MKRIVNNMIICYDSFGDNMKLNVNSLNIKIIDCNTIFKRAFGFMFKKEKINYGLLFNKCNSIHTFFMYQPIDVIMTDKNDNILFTYENLTRNKIILPKKNVYKTYEFPIGTIKKIESN
jgi:uncharacterized membrane protein (UPF0127 family)